MTFILSVTIVILIWWIGNIEAQLLEEKYEIRELRKQVWELELRDIEDQLLEDEHELRVLWEMELRDIEEETW